MAIQEAQKTTTPERRTHCVVIRTPLGGQPTVEILRERVINLGGSDTVTTNLGAAYSGQFSALAATQAWATYVAKLSPTMTPSQYMQAMAQLFDDAITEKESAQP
ncbi:MAG: hypothetical protein ACRCWJ_04855 [Casimicrobium sp.]